MAKTFVGFVSSDKTDKTVIVRVTSRKTHPVYKKQYISSVKFFAHDEQNEAREGDKVSIVETRPISRKKHFKLEKIIEKAPIKHVEQLDKETIEATGQNVDDNDNNPDDNSIGAKE